jgi:hypothetical protein
VRVLKSPLFTLLVFTIFGLSCFGGGWKGVVLLPPEDSGLVRGMMVNIVDESQRRGTYTVETDQGRLELESWRLETSEDSETVKAFFEEHQIYKDLYVVSEKQALPMREEPDKDTKLVYRIAKDQKLKVIRKMPGPVQVDRFEGYWYEVLSDDGVRGFAFDVYLVEFDAGTGALLVDENALQDEYAFLYERWRPEYFEEQINREFIDLTTFQERYGFQILPEEKTFILDLPEHTITMGYLSIEDLGFREYLLAGTNFRIKVTSKEKITLFYSYGNEEKRVTLVLLEEDIQEFIEEESLRRRDLFNNIFSGGRYLESSGYGRIELTETGSFSWTGYERLSPRILRTEWGNEGYITFNLGLSPGLRSQYTGVMSFNFVQGEKVQTVHFNYTLVEDGIRIVPVYDLDTIEDNIVGPQPRAIITISFRFLQG